MENEEARELLYDFQESAGRAMRAAVWAEAFLLDGGEATWDAVKSVSDAAVELGGLAKQVATFRDQFNDIVPF